MSLPSWRIPASVTERAKAWGLRLLDGLYWILLGATPAVLFLIFFDPHVLDPTRIGWTMEADWGQHVLGWNAFRHMPWSSGNHENLLYAPTGLNVIYTDSNPLFAFIFKLFRAWLPHDFQYIGIWFLFCVCMHFVFAYKLVRPHAPGKWAALAGAIALSALPCLYYRERHDTLMAQWLILWALHLFINVEAGAPRLAPEGASRLRVTLQRLANIFDAKTRGYMALLGVTGLIHPYLLFMVAAIWGGDVLRGLWAGVSVRNLHLTAKALVRAGVVLICPLVTLGISGCYAAGQSPNAGGWAYYSMALDALINPVRPEFSQIIKAVPLDGGQSFEGYQYLGFGLLMLLAAAAIIYAVTPEARRASAFFAKLKFLTLPFLVLFLTAITNRVQLYGHTIFFFQMPDEMKNTLAILRASGRFFWPMSYCMVLAALVVLYKSRPRIMAAVLPLVLLLQAYDLDGFAATVRAATSLASSPQTYYLTTSPKWDRLIAESKGVDFYPANVHFNDKLFYELTWRATSHALPVNTMYPARENILQLAKEEEGQENFRHGQIHKALQDKLRMLDGVWIIPPDQAKDVVLDKPVWTPIRSDVRFGWLDQGTCLLDDNWSKPDTDGTWSDGPKAGVLIPIKHVQFDDPNPKKVNLDLRAQSHKPVTVAVLVNGVKVSELKLDHVRQNYSIPLPANALRKDVMDVRFVIQDAHPQAGQPSGIPVGATSEKVTPAVIGRGGVSGASSSAQTSAEKDKAEQRMLGIKLIDMRLTTAKPAAAPQTPALRG
jgi:hypothetical protein